MQSRATANDAVLSAIGWQGRLNEAATPEEVVAVVRDFLARWSPKDFSLLPAECRPAKIVDAADVSDYAFTLMQRSCAGDRLSDPFLQRMATFFTKASLRLAQITAQAAEVSAEPPQA